MYLPVTGFAAELADRLYQQEAAVHARMGVRQAAAGGVQRKVPSGCGSLTCYEVSRWQFLRVRKKWWLVPIVLVLLLVGGLIVVTESAALAPFIYALF